MSYCPLKHQRLAISVALKLLTILGLIRLEVFIITMKNKVLIVDDSLSMRMLISNVAQKCLKEVEITHFGSAEEALEQIKTTPFNFYSIDYTLPGMSGIDLIKEVRRFNKNATIALVTANKQEAVKNRARRAGVTMIEKPDIEAPLFNFFKAPNKELTQLQTDFIKEQFNLGMGCAANELSQLVNEEVFMSVPSFSLITWSELMSKLKFTQNEQVTVVHVKIGGELNGQGLLVYPTLDSLELAHLLSHEFSPLNDLTELEEEALAEISGIIINNIISSIGNQLNFGAYTSVPVCERGNWSYVSNSFLPTDMSQPVMFVGMNFSINNKNLKGELIFLQDGGVINMLIENTNKALSNAGLL